MSFSYCQQPVNRCFNPCCPPPCITPSFYYALTGPPGPTGSSGLLGPTGPTGASMSNVFVFAPLGGMTGPNVYSTEASLSQAIGPTTNSTLVFYIPAISYDFTTVGQLNLGRNTTWTNNGFGTTNILFLNFVNGTTLTFPPLEINGTLFVETNQVPTVSAIPIGDTAQFSIKNFSEINVGIGNFINVSTGATLRVYLYDNTVVNGNFGTSYAFNPTDATGRVIIQINDQATVGNGTIPSGVPNQFILASSQPGTTLASSYYSLLKIGSEITSHGFYMDTTNSGTGTIPASGNNNGMLYTNGHLYVSDGATWNFLA